MLLVDVSMVKLMLCPEFRVVSATSILRVMLNKKVWMPYAIAITDMVDAQETAVFLGKMYMDGGVATSIRRSGRRPQSKVLVATMGKD